MNRRGFLQSLAIAASALAIDPERLLWTPGKKIFILTPPKLLRVEYFGRMPDKKLGRLNPFLRQWMRTEIYADGNHRIESAGLGGSPLRIECPLGTILSLNVEMELPPPWPSSFVYPRDIGILSPDASPSR